MPRPIRLTFSCVMLLALEMLTVASAQQMDSKTYGGLKWRQIGPFRGGRALAVVGVPSQPNTYYFGAVSGGIWKTTDGGNTWDPISDKQTISSIGAIAVADSDPNVIYAGSGEACIRGNISTKVGLKDSRHIGKVIVHPGNADVVFVAALGHAYGPNAERGIFRTRDGGKSWEKVLYINDRTGGIDIVFDPVNRHVLFAAMWEGYRTPWTLKSGGEKSGLYRSADDGTTWKRVEGNGMPEGPLGRIGVGVSGADSNVVYALIEAKQGDSGGPITKDQYSVEYYDVVFSLAESPIQEGVLWAGTDDGLIHVTSDGGKSWTNVTSKDWPEWAMVSLINASPFDAGKAYVAVDAHKLDNFKPYNYKTADYGKSWTKIIAGLPENEYVHAVLEDPARKGLLYAGAETGVWVSFDDGGRWQSLQGNLPNTPIHDLIVHGKDLAVATHGRSFWILDDLAPLRQMTSAIANESAHLFTPSPAVRARLGHADPRRYALGENPPDGAIIYYWLKEAPKQPAKLELLDARGKVIRSFTSEQKKTAEAPEEGDRDAEIEHIPAAAGLNRFAWNLRYESPVKIPLAIYDGDNHPSGPLALPGKYSVRLTVADQSYTALLELGMDPRVKTSAADLQKQFDFLLKLRDRQPALNRAILGFAICAGSYKESRSGWQATKPQKESARRPRTSEKRPPPWKKS
jgi:photosystem II stability/assembly factor-like uncharacterized protein